MVYVLVEALLEVCTENTARGRCVSRQIQHEAKRQIQHEAKPSAAPAPRHPRSTASPIHTSASGAPTSMNPSPTSMPPTNEPFKILKGISSIRNGLGCQQPHKPPQMPPMPRRTCIHLNHTANQAPQEPATSLSITITNYAIVFITALYFPPSNFMENIALFSL